MQIIAIAQHFIQFVLFNCNVVCHKTKTGNKPYRVWLKIIDCKKAQTIMYHGFVLPSVYESTFHQLNGYLSQVSANQGEGGGTKINLETKHREGNPSSLSSSLLFVSLFIFTTLTCIDESLTLHATLALSPTDTVLQVLFWSAVLKPTLIWTVYNTSSTAVESAATHHIDI